MGSCEMRCLPTSRVRLGEVACGFDPADCSDRTVTGRLADLEPQPKLGLRAQRRLRTVACDRTDPIAFGIHSSRLLKPARPLDTRALPNLAGFFMRSPRCPRQSSGRCWRWWGEILNRTRFRRSGDVLARMLNRSTLASGRPLASGRRRGLCAVAKECVAEQYQYDSPHYSIDRRKKGRMSR